MLIPVETKQCYPQWFIMVSLSMLASLSIMLILPESSQAQTRTCANQSQISEAECNTLVDLYDSTDGPNWSNNSGWLDFANGGPCNWSGITCNSLTSRVIQINLPSNNLSGPLPSLNSLTNLQVLDLAANQLTGPLPNVSRAGNLTLLDLNNNQLEGPIQVTSLPDIIEYLDLSSNKFNGVFPDFSGFADMTNLYVDRNQLGGDIPHSLVNLPLSKLSLSYNKLTASDPVVINFLNEFEPNWLTTQTLPPTNVTAVVAPENEILVSWTPIAYTNHEGYYQVLYATSSGGPYMPADDTTADKTATNYLVTDLSPGITYYFVVKTFTPAHDDSSLGIQQNDLTSEFSQETKATTRYIPLTELQISGPINGEVGSTYSFVATASPITASQPITYNWQATEQSPQSFIGEGLSLIDYEWQSPGTKLITVTAIGPANLITARYSITLKRPVLALTPTTLSYGFLEGSSEIPSQEFAITNAGGGQLEWTASLASPVDWLHLFPSSGTVLSTTTDNVNVTVTAGNLPPGSYTVPIIVEAASATNSPQTITVKSTIEKTLTPARLLIRKTAPPVVELNRPVTYTILVTNISDVHATDMYISDQLPADTTLITATEGWTITENQISWPHLNLAPGATFSRTLVVTTTQTRLVNDRYYVTAIAPSGNTIARYGSVPVTTRFSQTATGGQIYFQKHQGLGQANSQAVVLSDMDGDGDLDMLVGNASPNELWLNDGQGTFSQTQQILGDKASQAIALGDLDGDGDSDAVIVNRNNQGNDIWLNNGQGVFTSTGQLLGQGDSQAVALGDLNGDGSLDVVIGNGDNQGNAIWLNNGQGVFTTGTQLVGQGDTQAIALGDLNNDGSLDVVIGNGDNQGNTIWLNNGSGVFTTGTQLVGQGNTQAIALGDLNNDGQTDVVIGNGDDQGNQVWLNTGNGVFTTGTQLVGQGNTQAIALGDLNEDGQLDVVIGNGGQNTSQIWLNTGNGNFQQNAQPLNSTDSNAIALGDLNNDGTLDMVVGQGSDVAGQPNLIILNEGRVGRIYLPVIVK